MRPMPASNLKMIEHQTQQILARVFGINGSQILGDFYFVVDLGGTFLRDANLKGQK